MAHIVRRKKAGLLPPPRSVHRAVCYFETFHIARCGRETRETMTRKIALVACSAGKLDRPAPARDLYTSQLFGKARAYAENMADEWFILSAKHGLVHPDRVVAPYDMKLGAAGAPPLREWAAMVQDQLRVQFRNQAVTFTVLAGAKYRAGVPAHLSQEVPMEGLGIGQQLRYLTLAAEAWA